MRVSGFVAALSIFSGLCAGCAAQEEPRPSEFRQLFPHPTGQNGYEELVAAAELCRDSEQIRAWITGDSTDTLSVRRAVLADPQVQRALTLLRQGLNKPRTQIHLNVGPDTRFPELALFRLLSVALLLEQTVLVADGKVSQAIASFRDTLRLGAATRGDTNTMISGLVQIAIDANGMRVIGDHLNQLSARDCDKLLAVVREWLAEPDPTAEMLEGEKRFIAAAWDKAKTNPDAVFELLAPDEDPSVNVDSARKVATRQQIERILTGPGAYGALITSVKTRSLARIDSQIANLQLPPWERAPAKQLRATSLVDYMADLLLPSLDRFQSRFSTESARARLLGLHASILRYLWEHDRLPDRLEDLRVRDLVIDPYTGKPMDYKRTGERSYELSSVGPYSVTTDGSIDGARIRITVPNTR
jgi:hypothetical protein